MYWWTAIDLTSDSLATSSNAHPYIYTCMKTTLQLATVSRKKNVMFASHSRDIPLFISNYTLLSVNHPHAPKQWPHDWRWLKTTQLRLVCTHTWTGHRLSPASSGQYDCAPTTLRTTTRSAGNPTHSKHWVHDYTPYYTTTFSSSWYF